MAEEKQEKKKRNILKQIFRCIGLGLLAILLLLAIVFQAPWKVITLLLIVLAACTILPKHLRKWFWLSAAAIVVILIIWVFMPDDDEGWQRYKYNFDKELAAMEANRAIPDEENAAIIYNQLLESYDANDYNVIDIVNSDPNTFNNIFQNPWLSKDYPEIADRLKHIQRAIETLTEISKIKQCIFPIRDPANFESQIDRNAAMRRWARLLVIAINNDIAEGRIDKATQKNWCSDFTRILEHDKLCTKAQFATICYEINPKGKIRLNRDPLKYMRANLREVLQNLEIDNDQLKAAYERIAYPSYLGKKLIKTYTIIRWFYIPSNPQKAAKIIDSACERYHIMTNPDFDWQKEPRDLPTNSLFSISGRINYARLIERLAGMSEKTYYNLHYLYLRQIAENKGSQIIIALRRYKNKTGHWPESIDDVKLLTPAEIFVDPINGSSFVYKLTDDSFKLYSKGKNNIDEGGKRDRWDEEKTGADDWLIWPLKLPKTDEGKVDVESG